MENTVSHIDKNEIVISLQNLYKSFGTNHVLRGIDLQVYKGENVVVLGRSGTGKSVLIKLIAGLLKPDSGTVKVLGKEVDKLNEKDLQELRLKIGFSFQSAALYDSMSVRENLAFPLERHAGHMSHKDIEKEIESVLDAVGLSQAIDQMPSELSGGQRKRIGIARTIILHPQIMLYDEPTAGLDPITSTEINNLINLVQTQYKNKPPSSLRMILPAPKTTADRIAMMIEGKFIKQGSFEEIFNTEDERIKNFYNYNFTT